ncbi:hypothetical protein [Merismopedia glauca]|uniref:Uncharacterized protein n=1 Tax=Merismopedia glauca CCAP 1448/3 TaxID=1296344 RepID=A0A2T1BXI6_9CYAN|nr:hypothetical protein [Merismopedia glauca]PSB00725.1 hypothetical protein C7B64_22015 [Merismopedia glauca CCAP 1448/3]
MTPTLFGRWQTRLLLLATVGVLITLPFFFQIIGPQFNRPEQAYIYFWILGYVAFFGLIWDVIYHKIQGFRWDSDWPGALQLIAGIWEFVFVVCGTKIFGFLPIPLPKEELPPEWLSIHYWSVWIAVYIVSQSIMRIIFIRWRFKGGQWL